MRFVKIGHSWFNPTRIDRIRADTETDGGLYKPVVKIYLQAKTFYFEGDEIGMKSYYYAEECDAKIRAETMLHKVLTDILEAL